MFYKKISTLIFLVALGSISIWGQALSLVPKISSYGIDDTQKIIVWNFKISDSIKKAASSFTINFRDNYTYEINSDSLSHKKSYLNNKGYKLYITKIPLTKIITQNVIIDEPKKAATLTYYHFGKNVESAIGIELRGNTSLSFPKKSYDLDLWKDSTGKESAKIKLGKLREDDDWILDGIYDEPLRLRSYFASKLWQNIHKPHYINKEPKAQSCIDLQYSELFLNNNYKGLYTLTEKVDRKLLRLKKHEGNTIHGTLFKAASYDGGPAFQKAPQARNIFPHWAGFEMKYPVIDYSYYWNDLQEFVSFIIESDRVSFANEIEKRFYINNAIDYFLFINLIGAADNMGKNYYIARYDKNTPYFMVPWDLDGVLGTLIDGQEIASTTDVLSNGFFDRLISENPINFNQRLVNRWQSLRKTTFSNDSLNLMIDKHYTKLKKQRIYEREFSIWQSQKTKKEHLLYLKNWLKERLVFLDEFVGDLR